MHWHTWQYISIHLHDYTCLLNVRTQLHSYTCICNSHQFTFLILENLDIFICIYTFSLGNFQPALILKRQSSQIWSACSQPWTCCVGILDFSWRLNSTTLASVLDLLRNLVWHLAWPFSHIRNDVFICTIRYGEHADKLLESVIANLSSQGCLALVICLKWLRNNFV